MPNSVFLFDGVPFTGQMIGPAADNTAAPPFTFDGDLDTGLASSAANTLDLVTGGTARLTIDSTSGRFSVPITVAGTITETRTALATTSTDGIIAQNSTAATGGATVQISPRIRLRGNAWDTAASETVDFFLENLPATAATPTGTLKFGYSLNGAAATYPMTLTSAGALSVGTAGNYATLGFDGTNAFMGSAFQNVTVKAGGGADQWRFTGSAFLTITDNTSAIGTATDNRPANGYFGTALFSPIFQTSATNGQSIALRQLTELTTIAAAATTDTTIQMPAGAIVLAVNVRVTTVIPTATNFTVGDSGSAARFSTAAVSSAATSTDAGTKAGAYYNASALSVRITPDLTPAANTGRVRVTIIYFLSTPPTS